MEFFLRQFCSRILTTADAEFLVVFLAKHVQDLAE